MQLSAKVNIPQGKFLSLKNRFRAFVSGVGSGKTWVGCISSVLKYWQYPGFNQGYFAPTYGHIRDIFFPAIEEVAFNLGMTADIKEGHKEVLFFSGKQYRGTTICRSLDNPHKIIGFRISHGFIDELDIMPIDKARTAWRKILARMRYPEAQNTIDVTTTPEGFRFVYEQFKKLPAQKPEMSERYGLIQASTYDNAANLPPDYIPSLIEAYPQELIDAYINGQFVNLTSGSVYRNYNRERCNSTETIKENDVLHIGMDFNVQHMAAVVFVQRSNGYHAVAELKDVFDTPDMARLIQDKWQNAGHKILIYPDPSGGARKSVNAQSSDLAVLQQHCFALRKFSSAPMVRDRVLAVNKAFEDGRIHINAAACPRTAECLEHQPYSVNGEPDKSTGHDHQNDALGYFVAYTYPIIRRTSTVISTGNY